MTKPLAIHQQAFNVLPIRFRLKMLNKGMRTSRFSRRWIARFCVQTSGSLT